MIGLATIGQAPRTDVLPAMFPAKHASQLLQSGALDDMTNEQVSKLRPGNGDHPLVTRLASGEEVVIAKHLVAPLLEQAVRRLEAAGATIVCVLCTGEFDIQPGPARLVYPDRLLAGIIDSVLPAGCLGVLIPHQGQETSMRNKWQRHGREVAIQTASPYSGQAELGAAVQRLVAAGSDMLVLDCMGYGLDTLQGVREITSLPVVLANRMVGAVLETMHTAD